MDLEAEQTKKSMRYNTRQHYPCRGHLVSPHSPTLFFLAVAHATRV